MKKLKQRKKIETIFMNVNDFNVFLFIVKYKIKELFLFQALTTIYNCYLDNQMCTKRLYLFICVWPNHCSRS